MPVIEIVGQDPRILDKESRRYRFCPFDGHVLQENEVLQVSSGGGFDDPERPRFFTVPGTVVRRITLGSPHTYAITQVEIPE